MTDEAFDFFLQNGLGFKTSQKWASRQTLQEDYKAIQNVVTNKIAAAKRIYFSSKYGNYKKEIRRKGDTLSNNLYFLVINMIYRFFQKLNMHLPSMKLAYFRKKKSFLLVVGLWQRKTSSEIG